MKLVVVFFTLFSFLYASGSLYETDRQEFVFKNILADKNPGFENSKTGWTASGGTFAIASSGSNKLTGNASATWDSGSAAQTLTSSAITIPNGLLGRNGVGYCKILTPSGTSTHTLSVYDGSNTLSSTTITSSTNPTYTYVNFIFPSSGTVALRLTSVASDEVSITIDDCYLGDAVNLSNISQASLIAQAYFAQTTNCTWEHSGSSFTQPSDTDCPSITVVNSTIAVNTTDTNEPEINFDMLPPGLYLVTASGTMNNGTSSIAAMQISDGTTGGHPCTIDATSSTAKYVTCQYTFNYTTAGARSFKIFTKTSAGSIQLLNTSNGGATNFTVEKLPTASETAYLPDVTAWRVDATIGGSNPDLGTSDQASYVGITDAGLTMVQGTGSLSVQIPCSSTNSSTGLTCSVGDESVGVVYTQPRAGSVLACATFSHYTVTGTGIVNAAFQIVETSNNSQSVVTEGGARTATLNATASSSQSNPMRLCGVFNFTSAGQKTLRLMYEQDITTTVTTNVLLADAAAANGQRNIKWEVYPIDQILPMPVITNSVVSSANGVTKIETAELNCDSGSSIVSQYGNWVSSIGNISAGACTVTLLSTIFSAVPYCVLTHAGSSNPGIFLAYNSNTATSFNIDCDQDGGTDCTAYNVNIMCMGAK